MSASAISASDVEAWRGWIGRTEERTERLDAGALRRFAAALAEDLDVEARQPSLAHWAFFLPVAASFGADGHTPRGGFMPPIALPRRMFASSEMRFPAPLELDREARRVARIVDVGHKAGRTGDLVLVTADYVLLQDGRPRVEERQTIVFRGAGEAQDAIVPQGEAPAGAAVWRPGPVDLFRFSAATFNSHRIHYDLPYAREEEGYPDLVVHGPFTAARLFAHAARHGGRPTAFAFRASAPLFAGQPVALVDGATSGEVSALRCDGVTAMTATSEI